MRLATAVTNFETETHLSCETFEVQIDSSPSPNVPTLSKIAS
jgi:hypothetical protein